jgi:hypothetical protein
MTQRVPSVLGVESMRAGVPPPPRQMPVSPPERMPSIPFLPGAHPLPLLTLVALRRLSLTLSRVPERATMGARRAPWPPAQHGRAPFLFLLPPPAAPPPLPLLAVTTTPIPDRSSPPCHPATDAMSAAEGLARGQGAWGHLRPSCDCLKMRPEPGMLTATNHPSSWTTVTEIEFFRSPLLRPVVGRREQNRAATGCVWSSNTAPACA